MFVSSSGVNPTANAMEGGEALAANLAKSAQKLEGEAALKLLASTAQVISATAPSPSLGSTGSMVGRNINITA